MKICTYLFLFSLQTFGNGAIAQAILSQHRLNATHGVPVPPLGTELSINVGYGFGVMLGAYVAIGVSGGHMNPAVTLGMALRGKTSWFKVLIAHCNPKDCKERGLTMATRVGQGWAKKTQKSQVHNQVTRSHNNTNNKVKAMTKS